MHIVAFLKNCFIILYIQLIHYNSGYDVTLVDDIQTLRNLLTRSMEQNQIECNATLAGLATFEQLLDLMIEEFHKGEIEYNDLPGCLKDALGDSIAGLVNAIKEASANDDYEEERNMLNWKQAPLPRR